MIIYYNLQYLLRLYIYLHCFHGIYVSLSFLRYIITKFYNGSLYIYLYFYDVQKQIEDKKIKIEEIDDEYLMIS